MCGIAGIWSLSKTMVNQMEMQKMLAIQVHRGPEGAAFASLDNHSLLIGFLKLGFTDNQLGMQPLYNEDGTIAIVYNGEIYDYKEQREALTKKGHVFTTQSDSEVLIHLYEEHGRDFIHLLNGEFAFAIYDDNRKELFMARDPFGINPLCFASHNNYFLFSSEAKGILAVTDFPRALSATFLKSTSLGIPIASNTLFEGIYNLLPGHAMVVSSTKQETYAYWEPNFTKCKDSYEEATLKIRNLLDRGVSRRLEGKPPIAISLSSGLDSTIIAAITKKQGFKTESFSMGFKSQFFDEGQAASNNAKKIGIPHHVVEISNHDLVDHFSTALWHTETPTNSLTNTGRYLNNKSIRESGYKAIMGGESSDELFGGYPYFILEYFWDSKSAKTPPKSAIQEFIKREDLSKRVFWDYPKDIQKAKNQSPYNSAHIALLRSIAAAKRSKLYYSKEINSSITASAESLLLKEISPEKMNGLEAFDISRMIARNMATSLVFPSLADRLEMAASLEGRIPFLDIDLINYAYSLPGSYFIDESTMTGKKILRDAYRDILPKGYESPPKHTFLSSQLKDVYLLNKGKDLFNHYLSAQHIKKTGLLNPTTQKLLKLAWKSNAFSKSRNLFIDSTLVHSLSIQILNDLFITTDPLEKTDYLNFKMSNKLFSA